MGRLMGSMGNVAPTAEWDLPRATRGLVIIAGTERATGRRCVMESIVRRRHARMEPMDVAGLIARDKESDVEMLA